jgi:glycosyltransferase involved in cell wall biosynthesis
MKLSVIIPTRNRATLLDKALESILAQSLSQNKFEVILVDNGSTDNTKEIFLQYKSQIQNISYFYEEEPGLHVGRHIGMKKAKSDILVYLDDDVELFPQHLKNVLESFKDNEVVLVGGKNLPKFESTPPDWLQTMWNETKIIGHLSVVDLGDETKVIDPSYIWGCNFSIKKSILYEVGGFHPDAMPQALIKFRGDGETSVSNYVKNSEYKALYNPQVSLYHYVPNNRMTEEYFCNRMFNQGISDSYAKLRMYQRFSNLEEREKSKIQNAVVLKDKMYNYYVDGYIFHQKKCKEDKNLYEWVLRDKYYD